MCDGEAEPSDRRRGGLARGRGPPRSSRDAGWRPSTEARPSTGCSSLCVEMLDVSGASIAVIGDGQHLGSFAATSAAAATVDDLQFSLGEGPCISADGRLGAVLEPDLATADRRLARVRARRAGRRASRRCSRSRCSVGAVRLGVLTPVPVRARRPRRRRPCRCRRPRPRRHPPAARARGRPAAGLAAGPPGRHRRPPRQRAPGHRDGRGAARCRRPDRPRRGSGPTPGRETARSATWPTTSSPADSGSTTCDEPATARAETVVGWSARPGRGSEDGDARTRTCE